MHLPGKHEALILNISTDKKKKRAERKVLVGWLVVEKYSCNLSYTYNLNYSGDRSRRIRSLRSAWTTQ
jgi:hypothetical protein